MRRSTPRPVTTDGAGPATAVRAIEPMAEADALATMCLLDRVARATMSDHVLDLHDADKALRYLSELGVMPARVERLRALLGDMREHVILNLGFQEA